MPTSSVGRASSGVTLIEMLLVVAIVGLLAAITFPSFTSGLDSLRLTTACDAVASFMNAGLVHADQRRVPVELGVAETERALWLRSTEPGWVKRLELPEGVRVAGVSPAGPARFLMYPGGTAPRIGIELANLRGTRRIVRLNPMTGVAEIEKPEAP